MKGRYEIHETQDPRHVLRDKQGRSRPPWERALVLPASPEGLNFFKEMHKIPKYSTCTITYLNTNKCHSYTTHCPGRFSRPGQTKPLTTRSRFSINPALLNQNLFLFALWGFLVRFLNYFLLNRSQFCGLSN